MSNAQKGSESSQSNVHTTEKEYTYPQCGMVIFIRQKIELQKIIMIMPPTTLANTG